MTPDAFRAALAALGISQSGFARLAGIDARSVRRWAAGDTATPPWVPLLLRCMAAAPAAWR